MDKTESQTSARLPSYFDDPAGAVKSYHQLGYHVQAGVWTEGQIDELVRAAESLPSFVDKTYKPAMHPHRINPQFMSALKHPKLVRMMEDFLGGKISGIQSEMFFSPPGVHGFARHQDNHYVEAGQEVFASAWTALQDVTVHNGALTVWPGTHREPILPTEPVPVPAGSAAQDINAHKQQVILPAGYKALDVPVKKGEVVFIHGHIVHASHANRSEDFRRALLLTYVRQGEKFRPGNTARRAEVNLYGTAAS